MLSKPQLPTLPAGKTLIVPGLNGSGPGHWQHFWLQDVPDSHLVPQGCWSVPVLARWLRNLEAAIVSHPGAILVAHSLGAVLVAHLAKRPAAALVGGAILVAPADTSITARLHRQPIDFGDVPDDPLPFPSVLVGSYNDPYMSFLDVARFAQSWGATLVDLGLAGHINIDAGFGRWQAGYELLHLLPHPAR